METCDKCGRQGQEYIDIITYYSHEDGYVSLCLRCDALANLPAARIHLDDAKKNMEKYSTEIARYEMIIANTDD